MELHELNSTIVFFSIMDHARRLAANVLPHRSTL